MADSQDVDKKSFIFSRTIIASAVTALVPIIYPPAAAYIAANPQVIMGGLGILFAGLRLISHGKISIT